MSIWKNYGSITFKILFILLSCWALSLVMYIEPGYFNPSVMIYYTVLSNLLCLFYFVVTLLHTFRTLQKTGNPEAYRPRLQMAVVFCITVTMLIYHFMLAPIQFAMGNISQIHAQSNILLHYVLPLMTILDWILFTVKGRLRMYDPVMWLIFPYLYFIFTLIRAQTGGVIPGRKTRFPYEFIDVDKYGMDQVLQNVGKLTLLFLILGYFYYLIDYLLGRLVIRQKNVIPSKTNDYEKPGDYFL